MWTASIDATEPDGENVKIYVDLTDGTKKERRMYVFSKNFDENALREQIKTTIAVFERGSVVQKGPFDLNALPTESEESKKMKEYATAVQKMKSLKKAVELGVIEPSTDEYVKTQLFLSENFVMEYLGLL